MSMSNRGDARSVRSGSPFLGFGEEAVARPDDTVSLTESMQQMQAIMLQMAQNVNTMAQQPRASCSTVSGQGSIPPFDPEDRTQSMERWLCTIDEMAHIHDWDERTTIVNATSKLTGLASTWYKALPSMRHSWAEWKELLQDAFPSRIDFAEQLAKMMARQKKANETYLTYYYEKLAMLNTLEITGEKAVSCLLLGISDKVVQAAARAGQYTRPQQLFAYLRGVKDAQEERRPHQPQQRNIQLHQQAFRFRGQHGPRQERLPVRDMVCFYCGKRGHRLSECRQRQSQRQQPRTEAQPQSSRTGEYICLAIRTNLHDKKYFVDAKLSNKHVRAFIDMGATCNTLKISEVLRLGVQVDATKRSVIRGFGSGRTETLGETFRQPLRVDGVEAEVTFQVVPDDVQDIPMIIGQAFTELPGVRMYKDATSLRMFMEDELLPGVEGEISEKVPLLTKNAAVIPPGYVGHVLCHADCEGDLLVDQSMRGKPGQEHCVPRSVHRVNENREVIIPLVNISSNDLCVKAGKIIARGWRCESGDEVMRIRGPNALIKREDVNFGAGLDEQQKHELLQLLEEFSSCFPSDIQGLGCANVPEMTIRLTEETPITYRPYRMAHKERQKVKELIGELLDAGIIRESSSPFASPVLLLKKKNGEERLCIDYRKLNRVTVPDRHPLPRIDDQLDQLQGAKFFTSLDMMSGYYQIPVEEASKHKTAFVTPDGQYEFNRMPFGLTNAPGVFQRVVNTILGPMKDVLATAYLDDILSPSSDFDEGLKNLRFLLEAIRDNGLTLNLKKCHFFMPSINYLGFEIDRNGVRPGAGKVHAIDGFPTPKNVHQVRQFVGLTGFFRQFVKGYAIIVQPLTKLTKKDQLWTWGPEQEAAFQSMKGALTSRPLLVLYNPSAETEVHTDASKLGIGGILLQRQVSGQLQPVAYFSRQTTEHESVYHSYELETLAVVETLKKFRVYLLGITFRVVTDCNALKTASTKRDLLPKVARWWLQLQEFSFTVDYRPGTRMAHVDALSRNAVADEETSETPFDVLRIEVDDWVLAGQLTDEKLKLLRDILLKPAVTAYEKRVHQEYSLKDDRIFRGHQWVVPKGMRAQVVRSSHDDFGHFGEEKTVQKILECYWFPRMRKYVRKYLASCIQCLYQKRPTGKKEGMLNPPRKVPVPFHTLHVDHLGPFNKSRQRNTYLLVTVDAFTK